MVMTPLRSGRWLVSLCAAVVAVTALSSVGVQAAGVTSVTKPYNLGLGDVTGAAEDEPVGFDDIACNSQSISDACFYVDGTAHTPKGAVCDATQDENCFLPKVHIKATDANGFPVPMRVHWYGCTPTTPPDPTTPCMNGSGSGQSPSATNGAVLICGEGDYQILDQTTIIIDVRVAMVARGVVYIPPSVPPTVPSLACGQPEPVTQGTITVSGTVVKTKAPATRHAAGRNGLGMLSLPLP